MFFKRRRRYLDNRDATGRGRLHLKFEMGGKCISYAYIRKNACSTFKHALGFSPDTDIAEIAQRAEPERKADLHIFVYREPLARIVSLYRSKILEQRGASDLVQTYREAMGEEPSTFEKFAEFCTLEEDPHCWTQRSHLLRKVYRMIPIERLHRDMVDIVGREAAKPFKSRVNKTASTPVEITDRARRLIEEHYAEDYALARDWKSEVG
jgi:hypothetical protein